MWETDITGLHLMEHVVEPEPSWAFNSATSANIDIVLEKGGGRGVWRNQSTELEASDQ